MAVDKFVFEIILESVKEKRKKQGWEQSALAERVLLSHTVFEKKRKKSSRQCGLLFASTPFLLDRSIPEGNEQRV